MTTHTSSQPGNLTSTTPAATVWPCLSYADAPAIIDQLTTIFGFEARAVFHDPNDAGIVVHSELAWPEGGGVMLGTADRADSESSQQGTGHGCLYVVSDRVRELAAAASDAPGWTITRPLESPDYGGDTFTARDPEGNLWSFGSYRGEPAPRTA